MFSQPANYWPLKRKYLRPISAMPFKRLNHLEKKCINRKAKLYAGDVIFYKEIHHIGNFDNKYI